MKKILLTKDKYINEEGSIFKKTSKGYDLIKLIENKDGSKSVSLLMQNEYFEYERRTFKLDKLMIICFNQGYTYTRIKNSEIIHIDGDLSNNAIDNLSLEKEFNYIILNKNTKEIYKCNTYNDIKKKIGYKTNGSVHTLLKSKDTKKYLVKYNKNEPFMFEDKEPFFDNDINKEYIKEDNLMVDELNDNEYFEVLIDSGEFENDL